MPPLSAGSYRSAPHPDASSWAPVAKFLESFHHSILCYIPDAESIKHLPVTHSDTLDVSKQEQGYGIFYSVNGFLDTKSRTEKNLLSLNALYVDIDFPDSDAPVTTVKLAKFKAAKREDFSNLALLGAAPTFIVETKHGFHVLWCLEEPLLLDHPLEGRTRSELEKTYRDTLKAICTRLGGDEAATDLTRVLRLPNTWHQKNPTDPFLTRLEWSRPDQTYTLQALQDLFVEGGLDGAFEPLSPEETQKVIWKNAKRELPPIPPEAFEKLDKLFPPEERDSFKKLLEKEGHPEQGRNIRLLAAVSGLRRSGKTKQNCLDYFDHYNGLPDTEVRHVIESAYRQPVPYSHGWSSPVLAPFVTQNERKKAKTFLKTILADQRKERGENEKELFRAMTKEEMLARYEQFEHEVTQKFPFLRYGREDKDFYLYSEKRGVYVRREKEDIRDLFYRELEHAGLLSFRRATAVETKVQCLQSLPEVRINGNEMDADPDVLNLRNGLFNIHTHELVPHDPKHLSTIQLDASFRDEPLEDLCPRWLKFIEEITQGDKSLAGFLQRIGGYCLTKSTRFQCAFILLGEGANGKSTFTRALQALVGHENVSNITLDHLAKDFGAIGLRGKTLNVVEEISNNYVESSNVKAIISGERMTVNRKFKSQLSFTPFAKLLFAVNALPKTNDTSYGWYRRIHIIRLEAQFEAGTEPDLDERLASERDGILLWCAQGWRDCQESGLKPPPSVLHEGDRFKESNSPLVEFLLQDCLMGEAGTLERPFDAVYTEYEKSARDGHYGIKSKSAIWKELKSLSHPDLASISIRDFRGMRSVFGIKRLGRSFEGHMSLPT